MRDIVERAEDARRHGTVYKTATDLVDELVTELKSERAENKRLTDTLIRIQATR